MYQRMNADVMARRRNSPRGRPPFQITTNGNVTSVTIRNRTTEYGHVGGVWMWRNPTGSQNTRWHILTENRYGTGDGDAGAIHNAIADALVMINTQGRIPYAGGVEGMEIAWQGPEDRLMAVSSLTRAPVSQQTIMGNTGFNTPGGGPYGGGFNGNMPRTQPGQGGLFGGATGGQGGGGPYGGQGGGGMYGGGVRR